MVIANLTKSHFDTLSAILAGKAELKEVLEAQNRARLIRKNFQFVKDVVKTLS
jgi:replication-associated recombination protein RarA